MDSFVEFLLYLQGPVPYLVALGVLLACGLGVPIPEDLTLFAMGLLSYYGLTDLKTSIIVCFVGVMVGDCIVYFIGNKYGMRIAKKGIFKKLLHPERMESVRQRFHKWGNKVIFAARFMPGFRAPTFFCAGTLHLPFRTFFFYDGLAALLSVPLLVGVVYWFGDQVHSVIQIARKVQHGIVLIIVGIVLLFVLKYYAKQFFSKKRSRKH